MGVIRKIARAFLILIVILLLLSPFWIKNVPLKYLSFLTGKTSVVDNYVCKYSVKVSSDSMAPVISPGTSVELNRCFDESDLTEGAVVLFGKDSDLHLGIIRHILPLDPVVYKISNERPNERLQDMVKDEIAAINTDIDTSTSKYEPDPEEPLVLDPNEFVSNLYLGKIPRGYGEEMAEVEKTNTFVRDKDKFCMVVIPKKELAFVDLEIIDTKTGEVVISAKNIVFNVRPDPNKNCQDFGSDPEKLDLNPGSYRYRFLLNHQALGDIAFSIE